MARRTWTFAYIYFIWVNEQLVFDVAQRESLGVGVSGNNAIWADAMQDKAGWLAAH